MILFFSLLPLMLSRALEPDQLWPIAMIAYAAGHVADLTSHVFRSDFQPRKVGKGRLIGAGVVVAQLLVAFLGAVDLIMIFYGATLVFHIFVCGLVFYDTAAGGITALESNTSSD